MDLLSHAAFAAGWSESAARRGKLIASAAVGALAGMAPDVDTLVRSSSDPLLLLETHRRFTHALPVAPVAALLVAALAYMFVRRRLTFRETYLFSLLGYVSHCLLDACTSYGTELLWPFSNLRVAWSDIAVFDPLFTLPVLLLVVAAAVRGCKTRARCAVAWALAYLALGALQHERALDVDREIAAGRGHVPVRIEAKPALASLLLWKVIYEYDGRYYVDAVRAGIEPSIYIGQSVPKLDVAKQFPWLDRDSQQARDLDRFSRISDHLVAARTDAPRRVVDLRYSMVPNETDAFWAIVLDPDAGPNQHVGFLMTREHAPKQALRLLKMIL